MPVKLTDLEINILILDNKILPDNFSAKMQLKQKRGHNECELSVPGTDGSDFCIFLRQSSFNPLDFSAILAYRPLKSNIYFRLRRYNGKSHEHTNKIEGDSFYGFHIHYATERYQELCDREDGYAQPTNRYSDMKQAVECMIEDCGFIKPDKIQTSLFE